MAIKKIITADVRKNGLGEILTFSEYMKDSDISINSVIGRRFREMYPNEAFSIRKVSIEIVDHNNDTGNETVITRFFI